MSLKIKPNGTINNNKPVLVQIKANDGTKNHSAHVVCITAVICLDLNSSMEVSVPLTILSMLDAPCIDLNSLWMSRRVSCSAAVNCTVARLVRSFPALRLKDVSNVAWDFI